jgi:protein required for attachment to host cells
MKLANKGLVVVADGEKALLLRNRGAPAKIALEVEEVREAEETAAHTRDLGTDKPGRFDAGGGQRAAAEQTDWKRRAEEAHIRDLAEALNARALAEPETDMVLMLDPRSLGVLREALSDVARARVIAEVPGDFIHETVERLSERVAEA